MAIVQLPPAGKRAAVQPSTAIANSAPLLEATREIGSSALPPLPRVNARDVPAVATAVSSNVAAGGSTSRPLGAVVGPAKTDPRYAARSLASPGKVSFVFNETIDGSPNELVTICGSPAPSRAPHGRCGSLRGLAAWQPVQCCAYRAAPRVVDWAAAESGSVQTADRIKVTASSVERGMAGSSGTPDAVGRVSCRCHGAAQDPSQLRASARLRGPQQPLIRYGLFAAAAMSTPNPFQDNGIGGRGRGWSTRRRRAGTAVAVAAVRALCRAARERQLVGAGCSRPRPTRGVTSAGTGGAGLRVARGTAHNPRLRRGAAERVRLWRLASALRPRIELDRL